MQNKLELINNDLITEKIIINSLEKLDNNYIRVIGNDYFKRDVDVITNGTLTFNFSSYKEGLLVLQEDCDDDKNYY